MKPTFYVSSEARFLRVAEIMRVRITDGHYGPHHQLPGSRTLAKEIGVSRQTVEKALDVLAKGNLLYHVARRGYFVAVAGDLPRCPCCGRELEGT